jgi:hypothetical protein
MNKSKQLHCCLGCGRDTRGDYCPQCIGHSSQIGKGRGRRARPLPEAPLEDNYSEESDANSVCQDCSS